MTLILGHNGAGKTVKKLIFYIYKFIFKKILFFFTIKKTILESLKCITTGAYPPNSDNGKKFLIDPKFISRSEVQSKIGLKFTAINKK